MEVAAGGAGDGAVTDAPDTPDEQPRRRGLTIGLGVLALLLVCASVFGGVLVLQEHRDRQRAEATQERYGDVLVAARAEVTALVNIDYRDAQASFDKVAAGATGDFAKQYKTGTSELLKPLTSAKSVMAGKVLWAGVVDVDADSATVIAATTGTVTNTATGNKPVARNFRMKLDLVDVDGTWKTNNVEWVG